MIYNKISRGSVDGVPTRIISNMRNLADTYVFTSSPVEPQEIAKILRRQAEELERFILHG